MSSSRLGTDPTHPSCVSSTHCTPQIMLVEERREALRVTFSVILHCDVCCDEITENRMIRGKDEGQEGGRAVDRLRSPWRRGPLGGNQAGPSQDSPLGPASVARPET